MSTINNELKSIIANHRPLAGSDIKKGSVPTGAESAEFSKILNNSVQESGYSKDAQDIVISLHAQKRLEQRSINLDGQEYAKLKQALQSLEDKGGRESLVVTDKAAYIMDVANKKLLQR
jgi:flagellar operon protein